MKRDGSSCYELAMIRTILLTILPTLGDPLGTHTVPQHTNCQCNAGPYHPVIASKCMHASNAFLLLNEDYY